MQKCIALQVPSEKGWTWVGARSQGGSKYLLRRQLEVQGKARNCLRSFAFHTGDE